MASPATAPVRYEHTDRKGWLVVFASFICSFVICGNLKALGVLLIPMTSDLDSELWLVGWLVVWYNVSKDCTGPIIGALSRMFSTRLMIVCGGLFSTLGFILTSVSPNVAVMSIFIVGLSGLGSAFIFFNIYVVVASYFTEKYPLAIGIAMMGMPLGLMAYGPMTQVLLDTYGWRGTVLLLGGISFHLVPCGMLGQRQSSRREQYQEISNTDEADSSDRNDTSGDRQGLVSKLGRGGEWARRFKDAVDVAVLADARFILLTCGRCTISFAYSSLMAYMVSHGQFQGLSKLQASILPTALGIGIVAGRMVAPCLQQLGTKPPAVLWACIGSALMGALFVEAFIRPFVGQLAVMVVIGIGVGMASQATDVMVWSISSFPRDGRLVSRMGWLGVFKSIAGLVGGLISGWIYEWTGSFIIAYCVCGGITLLSIPFFVVWWRMLYTKRTEDQ
ncbi:monocarboxylate transporter 13-like [Patiria miniata]|uniref:Major facilitator superfamily (MFS) profile domain-containing protein n=1 Tax=Patiria miniata TaxID=46514 RepID=A0A914BIQ8_PATMI|nr:monocarboxylate transporter 13-like [Patiria miniata]